MKDQDRMIVNLPIEVPKGRCCWNISWETDAGTDVVCSYFDNDGGHPSCAFGFSPVQKSVDGTIRIVKDKKCASLIPVKTVG